MWNNLDETDFLHAYSCCLILTYLNRPRQNYTNFPNIEKKSWIQRLSSFSLAYPIFYLLASGASQDHDGPGRYPVIIRRYPCDLLFRLAGEFHLQAICHHFPW